MQSLVDECRVQALMQSEVDKITPEEVVLRVAGTPLVLPNDFVIVNIGGELPLEFLSKLKISLEKHSGEELKKPHRTPVGDRRGLARERAERTSRRRAHVFYLFTG